MSNLETSEICTPLAIRHTNTVALICLDHFFWNAGTPLQKSREGSTTASSNAVQEQSRLLVFVEVFEVLKAEVTIVDKRDKAGCVGAMERNDGKWPPVKVYVAACQETLQV
jgi:hypothetical protein